MPVHSSRWQEKRTSLETAFAAHGVQVAWLFGSQARGTTRAESDIDIAVLFGEAVPPEEYPQRQLELIGVLMEVFATNAVDLVVLNTAPPLLAFEVLQDGCVLYNADDAARVNFQVRALQEYRDTAPLRRLLAEGLVERIRDGTFGKPEPCLPRQEKRRRC